MLYLLNRLNALLGSAFHRQTPFIQWYLNAKVPQIRYIAFLTASLYVIYAFLEVDLTLSHSALRLWFHAGIVPAMLLLIGLLSFFPAMHGWMRLLLVLAPVGAVFGNLYLNEGFRYSAAFAPELYLNIVWTFAISGLPLWYALLAATSSVTAIVVVFILHGIDGTTEGFSLLTLFWIAAAYLFGFVSAYILESAYKALYRQQQQLHHSASVDSLTELWNRDKMTQLLRSEKANCDSEEGLTMSVIMLDIDYFKEVNDTYGHGVGDKVLSSFAALLKRNVRQQDQVGRHGGEEFFILLPQTNVEQAFTVAQLLRNKINHLEFEDVGNKTASFGVTQYWQGETLSQLLTRADKALYKAKAKGRNCIEVV
ncbi:GGDEF domain-containing protein [Gallaecimonas mangrovi]|uniref:GGDEF domain-containing protein n=1 Tax=Gallaecimonas mangrovi TaxID=2291597 RepID=UPI00126028C6|nr:GGDEF domain-containing protein [Gallaecimonas mangrovi]